MPVCSQCGFVTSKVPRSGQQNRAYFGLAVERIAFECGSNKEDMHKALAGEFLGYEKVTMPDGTIHKVPRSTKSLSTKEFMDYIEKIQRWAAENGIDIPNPGEYEAQ